MFIGNSTLKRTFWVVIRGALIYYLFFPLAVAYLIISNPTVPYSPKHNYGAMVVVLLLVLIFGLWLITRPRFKEDAILLLLCCLGAFVLLLHHGHYIRSDFYPYPILVDTFIRAGLLIIAAIYFVFPVKQIRSLLIVLPVFSGAWFILKALLTPIPYSTELITLLIGGAFADEETTGILTGIVDLHQHYFIAGSLDLVFVIIYFFVLYGHNPKKAFRSLRQRFSRS